MAYARCAATANRPGHPTGTPHRGRGRQVPRWVCKVCLETTCRVRVLTVQTAPQSLRGTVRSALRAGLRSATAGDTDHERVRGWGLFFLGPPHIASHIKMQKECIMRSL